MHHPAVAVLLAVYEPREEWLSALLDSLNAQTLLPACLYVRDDASPSFSVERLRGLLEKHVTAFPFVLSQSEGNQGSNKTFAALLRDAREPYVAFCDQDDVWLPEKLQRSVALLLESPLRPLLVCSDVSVIDSSGRMLASHIGKLRPRHILRRGYGLSSHLLYRNFAIGCTILIERERALSYLPFPPEALHDHYLAFRASLDGALDYLPQPQVLYRVHGANQTGVMTGISSKEDYIRKRIPEFLHRVQAFGRYTDSRALREALLWGEARAANANRQTHGMRRLFFLRRLNRATSYFELIALRLPSPLFRMLLRAIEKGIL